MRERVELHVERPHLEPAVERNHVDRKLEVAAVLGKLRPQHARREGRGIDRCLEAWPQLDHGADMILVRVRQHQPGEVAPLLLDEAHVGQDDVDAGIVLALGKRDAAIDHQPLARILGAIAVEVGVHADLTETAQRYEYELVTAVDPGPHHALFDSSVLVVLLASPSGSVTASVTSPYVKCRSRRPHRRSPAPRRHRARRSGLRLDPRRPARPTAHRAHRRVAATPRGQAQSPRPHSTSRARRP